MDSNAHVIWQDFDGQGRLVHRAEYSSAQGCSAPPGNLDNTTSREEWRDYELVKPIAQGVSLPLEVVTAISRKSTLSRSKYVAETISYDPGSQGIDPAGYSCQESPLPVGSAVCRRIAAGYEYESGSMAYERHATFLSYDARGRLVRSIGPVSLDSPSPADVAPVEERSYWADAESLPRRGRLKQVRRYANSTSAPLVTSYDYDSFGVFQETDPTGGTTTIVNDGRGRPVAVLTPDGRHRQTRYYDGLRPRIELGPGGGAVRYGYDLLGRTAAVERLSGDPDLPGASPALAWGEYYSYDAAGNRAHAERRDGSGAVTWQQDRRHDVQHRVVQDVNPEAPNGARVLTYDASGFLSAALDEEGRAVRFTPDALNRVLKATRSDPGGTTAIDVARYSYQPNSDSISQVTVGNGGNTDYQYDDFGRVFALSSNNLATPWSFQYDARGNLLKRSGSHITMTYAYDGLNRPVSMSATLYNATVPYTFRYDEGTNRGRLTSVIEQDRTIAFDYDEVGRLRSETIRENGIAAALVTQYVHDADGLVGEILYPSGLHVQLNRDPASHEVTSVTRLPGGQPFASGVAHHPGGPAQVWTLGNGLVAHHWLNLRYEPTAIASGPLAVGYVWSPAGDVASATEAATTRTFEYDFLDRITEESGSVAYGYDSSGNRTWESVAGQPASYTYSSDRVARRFVMRGSSWVPQYGFGYDRAGNMSGIALFDAAGASITNAMCFVHDALGRVTLVGYPNWGAFNPTYFNGDAAWNTCASAGWVQDPVARFKYDFRGRRTARWLATANQWTYVVSDAGGNPLSELVLSGGAWIPVRDYVWLDGRPIAQVEYGSGQTYYYHVDQIGLPRALTNQAGQVVWSAAARPYGDLVESTATDPLSGQTVVTNLRLPGQYDERLLGSVGLQGPYYNWHRWYLPGVGRYLELDPIAMAGGFNTEHGVDWYNYAGGNPLSNTDPDGRVAIAIPFLWKVGLAGAGALAVCQATRTCPWHINPPTCATPPPGWPPGLPYPDYTPPITIPVVGTPDPLPPMPRKPDCDLLLSSCYARCEAAHPTHGAGWAACRVKCVGYWTWCKLGGGHSGGDD